MKKLICIYTCNRDKQHLDKLKQTDWYEQVTNDESCQVLEVYADPDIQEESILELSENMKDGILILKTEEAYDKLSLKTFNMIKACVSHTSDFDYLIKVDATLIDYDHPHPNIDFNYFVSCFNQPSFYKEYNGICKWGGVSASTHYSWTQRKGIPNIRLEPMVEALGNEPFAFYSGKCYVLNNDLCKHIAAHGETMALVYATHLAGVEDIMIYKLYENYKQHKETT